jgi:isoleucyl-tRNA synthetase
MTKETVLAAARHIAQKGSDSWFTDSPREILGEDFVLPDGFDFDDLHKEENIFDVWFESGCSWYSAAFKGGWAVPVDLYLEGSDQHRGWFQLSLLPALGATGREPFKSVLTHGFVVDEKGMKQSKSLGNYVNAQDEVGKYGADILRLWVASVNYQEDIRCNDELIGRTQDAYRKIRNTVQQLQKLIAGVREAYDNFLFHRAFSLLYNFCTVEMSSIYMDVLKDRMYCDGADSSSRRSGQTAMYRILDALVRMLTPILVHTAEEAWSAMKFKSQDAESVHTALMPEVDGTIDWQHEEAKWSKLMGLRDEVLRVLEALRREQKIGSNQEASVTVYSDDEELAGLLNEFGLEQFAALCIVSEVKLLESGNGTTAVAEKSSYVKCQRCWNYWPSVGQNSEYPDLCERCVTVVIGR